MTAYAKLEKLQIALPVAEGPVAAFVPTVQTGNPLFVSGHIAKRDGKPWVGILDVHLTTEAGKRAARNAAIDLLATLHHELQDLERVKRIVEMLCPVNSSLDYRAAVGCKRRVRTSRGSIRRQGKACSQRFPALKSN